MRAWRGFEMRLAARRSLKALCLCLRLWFWLGMALVSLPFAAQTVLAQPAGLVKESRFEFPSTTLLDGRTLAPDYWKGKVVIIERWASWCPFCARQNPNLNALHQRLKSQGLEVLALSVDKEPAAAQAYQTQKQFAVNLQRLGRIKMLPEVWVIGRDGRFKEHIPGEMFPEDVDELERWLSR
jgi:thiol-disulfide isomerase/thioredoxin